MTYIKIFLTIMLKYLGPSMWHNQTTSKSTAGRMIPKLQKTQIRTIKRYL